MALALVPVVVVVVVVISRSSGSRGSSSSRRPTLAVFSRWSQNNVVIEIEARYP